MVLFVDSFLIFSLFHLNFLLLSIHYPNNHQVVKYFFRHLQYHWRCLENYLTNKMTIRVMNVQTIPDQQSHRLSSDQSTYLRSGLWDSHRFDNSHYQSIDMCYHEGCSQNFPSSWWWGSDPNLVHQIGR